MKKLLFAVLMMSVGAFGQTITTPQQVVTTTITIQGTTVKVPITIPSQKVAWPFTGITWANSALTVNGTVTAKQLSLTGGGALPASASGYYLFQLVNGVLTPVAYPPATTSAAKPAVAKKVSPPAAK